MILVGACHWPHDYRNCLVLVDVEGLVSDGTTLPPKVTKKVGRPKKKRIRSRGEVDVEDRLTCGGWGRKRP